jgi:hypothetical protein
MHVQSGWMRVHAWTSMWCCSLHVPSPFWKRNPSNLPEVGSQVCCTEHAETKTTHTQGLLPSLPYKYLSSVRLTKSPTTIPSPLPTCGTSHPCPVDLAGGFGRRARQEAKRRGVAGEKLGVFLGLSPNMGLVVGKRLTVRPRNTVRCGEWVERIDDNCAAEREGERSKNNKEGDKNRVKCRQCH